VYLQTRLYIGLIVCLRLGIFARLNCN